MARFALPDLPYDYNALEPHISARIMELHHDKHHKTYVDGANKTLEQLEEARAKGSLDTAGALARTLAFHVSGHVLHSLFWQNLSPNGGGKPTGELAQAIDRDFGSFDAFKTQFTKTAGTVLGSGWAALTWDTLSQSLIVAQIHDHQSDTFQGAVPLLVLDAWEHAFYLQYANEKMKFFEAVWNVFNWNDVASRYSAARGLNLGLKGVSDAKAGAAR
jgi:Fe-Mn family superoxide dismutase